MTTKRDKVVKDMNEVIAEMQSAKNKVIDFVDAMETAQAEGKQAIADLQEQLAEAQEHKAKATDLATAQELVKKAQELQGAISLQSGVLQAISNNNKEQLEELIVELLQAYRKAKATFTALDDEITVTTSIRSYDEDLKMMRDFANKVNGAIGFATSILISQGIIEQGTKTYKGFSMSGRGQAEPKMDRVIKFDNGYLRDYRAKGVL
jgi:uncharacterized membrane protein YgaE (UPF0421/DUF939 family)